MRKHLRFKASEAAKLPTKYGSWSVTAFHDTDKPDERNTHLAFVFGDVAGKKELLTRVHSSCLTSEVFGSLRCDCAGQLDLAMRRIAKAGAGTILYLRHEGRGIGLFNKIRAYHLQDHGFDTIEANKKLGLPVDSREYHAAVAMLKNLGVVSIRLLSSNPAKCRALKRLGILISARLPVKTRSNRYNKGYLDIKRRVLRHDL